MADNEKPAVKRKRKSPAKTPAKTPATVTPTENAAVVAADNTAPDKKVEQGNGRIAVLPLRDIVVFPHMIVPLFVGREKSVKALESVTREDRQILLIAQKDAAQDDPGVDDVYRFGTVSTILQLLKLPDAPSRCWWKVCVAHG